VIAPVPYSLDIASLDITRPRGVAVRMYSEWQQSKAVNKTLKAEFQKVCNVTLNDGLDLEQAYRD
jgi:hypothetical protein